MLDADCFSGGSGGTSEEECKMGWDIQSVIRAWSHQMGTVRRDRIMESQCKCGKMWVFFGIFCKILEKREKLEIISQTKKFMSTKEVREKSKN